jgi:sodium-dependent phosphate cotransporter|mmetsp:Transcript_39854/g.119911  ORF Transcript_39854/g.119911 Transcript_39854/m.119911 type:complete len:611 (-) Transcript_39854:269-2101(-)|eukprot:CAMPEP_0113550800 /NCGR_PEP_ID=MMETSP0015_2-20120614/14178_1 /TAXON_ID=2838 /ORGANISM="Odontella" /LENGTH=610 /DNA_ID=CAMNT_0000451637 /DNA_START=246 /DNA_END=2078 /DNA_ORIENTATION=+ /assembly_acc=CAM_ASM_000160
MADEENIQTGEGFEEEPTKEVKSRKERMTGSTHFGDSDFYEEDADDIGDATWGEVCRACCVHTPKEWGIVFIGLCVLCFFLYFFLLGLDLLGSSAKVLGGCTAGSILGNETNPIAAMMIGVLATVLLQSSSTTTSIVVGLVGGGAIQVQQAIYMIMGANIGTTVTNTIVAMGHLGNGDELERAFAGATVHDCFNYISVIILLPLEAATGYLYKLTKAMLPDTAFEKGDKWVGPIKKIVSPLGNKIIKANKKIISAVADPESDTTCDDFYPVKCKDGIEDYKHCKPCSSDDEGCDQGWGLIECDKSTGLCPAFFQNGANQSDDHVAGGVCLFLSLVILIVCLIGLVSLLQRMLLGTSTRIIYKATNINGYLAMLLGCAITILVQSSSITTSTLTPLVGMGVIQIEQMFPLTLGANIGTTFTAIMAAMVSDKIEALQTALAHLFFNLSGILIWYPLPFMRRIPINMARRLGKATRIWRFFPIVYIVVMFFVVPAILLGLSSCFEQGSKGFTVLGSFLVIISALCILYFVYWWKRKDGREKCVGCLQERQRNSDARKALPDDMEYLKAEVSRLREHTGLPEEDDEEDGDEDAKDVEGGKQLESSEEGDVEEEA